MRTLWVIVLFSQMAWTQVYWAKHGDRVTLSAPKCADINLEMLFVQKVNERLNQTNPCQPNFRNEFPGCAADVQNCLPPIMRENQDATSKFDQPNCFGLVMSTLGIAPALGEGNDEELSFWLQPPLCQFVPKSEVKPGDVGMVYWMDDLEHAFVYVSPNTAWSKNGLTPQSTYSLQPLQKVERTYLQDFTGECEECRHVKEGQPSFSRCKGCFEPKQIRYFRCENIDQYLKRNQTAMTSELTRAWDEAHRIECQISNYLFGRAPLDGNSLKSIHDLLNVLNRYAEEETKKQPIKIPIRDQRDLLLGGLILRLDRLNGNAATLEFRTQGDLDSTTSGRGLGRSYKNVTTFSNGRKILRTLLSGHSRTDP